MNPIIRRTFYQVTKPQLFNIILILILMLAITGLRTLSPWVYKILLDNVLGNELLDSNTITGKLTSLFPTKVQLGTFVVVAFFLINATRTLLSFIYSLFSSKVMQAITFEFASTTFQKLFLLDYGYFRQQDIGQYLYKLNSNISAVSSIINSSVLPFITAVLYLATTIFILVQIDINMTLISLTIFPLLWISLYIMNKKITAAKKQVEVQNSTFYTFIEQTLTQFRSIQSYLQETITHKQYRTNFWKTLATGFKADKQIYILNLINGLIIISSYTTIISLGIRSVNQGSISTGLLVVFILYLDTLTSPMLRIIKTVSNYRQALVRLNNLSDIYDPTHYLQDTGTLTTCTNHTIQTHQVTVRDSKQHPILQNLSLTIPTGSFVAIVGRSGSGKSTLVNMLLRLEEPDTGHISLDGRPINDYTLKTLRQQIAFVPQETMLFNQSIADIIGFGKPQASQSDIQQAAQLACAHEFISQRDQGYQTKVGDRGNLLSGGQRQRLLLARAYLKDSPILILDEIFSAQDQKTQQQMMRNLRHYAINKTVLMITHTYKLLREDDLVLILDQGQLITIDTFSIVKARKLLPTTSTLPQKGGVNPK